MKVVQVCIGKFHHFDLARQLDRRGMLEAIFTGYPRAKLGREGMAPGRIRCFPWIQTPYMGLVRSSLFKGRWERNLAWLAQETLDRHVARNLPQAEWLFAISGSGLHCGRRAKSMGMRVVCDRGSTHMRFQQDILREEFRSYGESFAGIDPRMLAKEEAEYHNADLITVPSEFARQSFIECGVTPDKVRKVPYGVELGQFSKHGTPPAGQFEVLFAGQVGIRKGLRYLLESFSGFSHPRKHLTVVGGLTEAAKRYLARHPVGEHVTFLGHVPQERLRNLMSRSHVLVLPSVEEGLALVQAQAMACGCPVIATRNTGAAELFQDGDAGFIVEPRDSRAITERLQQLADDESLQLRMSQSALNRVLHLGGWDSYGELMARSVFCEKGRGI